MTDTEMILQAIGEMDKKIDSIKEDALNSVKVLLETIVTPKLQILAEGHELILEQMPKQEVIDDINDRIAALDIAVRTNAREIAKLKQAN